MIDAEILRRLHWRCRRGLLELDIVLGRFVEARYASLNIAQQRAFDVLLDLPDTVLWGMISGEAEAEAGLQNEVLALIKAA